jgi:hypothetical protein
VVATSALSEERMARLQGIDEATDRIDDMLTDLISHPKSRDARHALLSNGGSRGKDGVAWESVWRIKCPRILHEPGKWACRRNSDK